MKKHILCVALCSVLLLAGGQAALAQTVYAVKADADGAETGLSWDDAFTGLQSALDVAVSGDEIWIAAGTYYPTDDYGLGTGNRGKHFELKNGVAIYGGFEGSETGRNKRDPENHVVTLSGDIGTSGDADDNCYHVFYHPADLALDNTAILDGVTISEGNASDDDSPHNRGGGMYNVSSSPQLTGCTFSDNAADDNGGAMYNNSSSPGLSDCVFSANTAEGNGAGIYNNSSSPSLTNCAFSGNAAQYGGGIFNGDHSSPTVKNCVLSGNEADISGGGIYNLTHSAPVLTNCSFSENTAGVYGGGIYSDSSSPSLRNCILWGDSAPTGPEVRNANGADPEFRYCDVAGSGGSGAWQAEFGTDDGGNIAADPLFVDAAGDDLHLQVGSPCIDAADGAVAPTLDTDGNRRFDSPNTVNTGTGNPDYADIGAYEYQLVAVTFPSNSGISVEVGKTVQITWVSSLPSNTPMQIELIKGGAETWELSPAATKGKFKWTVGKWKLKTQAVYPDGNDYRIRISTLDESYSDESDNDFAIGRVTSLTVSGPADITGGVAPVQYTCVAHYNFGDDRDVTNEAKWSITKIKGVKLKIKGGLLTTPVVAADIPCTVTATYGKGKPPVSDTLDITVHTP